MSDKITLQQMKDAVLRSGYLLEQRVLPALEEAGFYVEANPVFPDPLTGKSREYDFTAITAIRVYRDDLDFLWIHLLGECVNNHHPIVCFASDPVTDFLFHEDIKCAGIPLRFTEQKRDEGEMSFQEFFRLNKFHHYCRGPFSTQYCSFQQKKQAKAWMAWHDDEHHRLFDTLVAATEYEIEELLSSWQPPRRGEEEPLNLNIFYPLLIARGDLFECKQEKGGPVFEPRSHVQFRKRIISGQQQKTFHIDIVIEAFLAKYLKMLEDEHEELKVRLRRKKKHVRLAIDRIASEMRKVKNRDKREGLREILQF